MPYNKFPDAFQMRQKGYFKHKVARVSIRLFLMNTINWSNKGNMSKSRSTSTPSVW